MDRAVVEPNSVYHSTEPISKSRLFNIKKSPKYFKWKEEQKEEPTEAMIRGSAFHKLVLEPDDFSKEYIVLPKYNMARVSDTEEYIARLEQLVDEDLHRDYAPKIEERRAYIEYLKSVIPQTVITQEMYNQISKMRDSVMSDKYAKELLKNGIVEQSFYWTDEITGEECKCRPDSRKVYGNRGVIVDLKSTKDASTQNFIRDSIKLGYDLQCGMYKSGVDKITGIPHEFIFIAVEIEPPYEINILKTDEFYVTHGTQLFRDLIGLYHECKTTNNWYGYNGEIGTINTLTLPPYMLKEFQENN